MTNPRISAPLLLNQAPGLRPGTLDQDLSAESYAPQGYRTPLERLKEKQEIQKSIDLIKKGEFTVELDTDT